jgi:hypothetical protein
MGVEQFIVRLLPILSNLLFLVPAARALKWEYEFDAFVWAFVALFTSPSYHLCTGFDACLWSVQKHRLVDFWSAEMAMPMVATYFMRFRSRYVRTWFLLISMVAIGLLVAGTDSSFMNQAIIGVCSAALVFAYIGWHRYAHGYWPEYDVKQLVAGLGFLALGVCFFTVQEWWPPYYGYNHSNWHASDAVGIAFMIGIRPPDSQLVPSDGGGGGGSGGDASDDKRAVVGSSVVGAIPRRGRLRFSQRGHPIVSQV